MELEQYTQEIQKTFKQHESMELELVDWTLGLTGEAGEVANEVKKGMFHGHGLNKEKLVDEMGDVLWYLMALCVTLGVSPQDVMQHNIDKLRKRYGESYSNEKSINRSI